MLFEKSYIYILILLLIHSVCIGQNSDLETIKIEDLKRHLTFLSSDSLQGRSFGTPVNGIDIAADYIKANAKRIGLTAGADDYFQIVPIVSSQPDSENIFLEISDQKGKVIFKTDSIIGLPQESKIEITNAEIVFTGFGFK